MSLLLVGIDVQSATRTDRVALAAFERTRVPARGWSVVVLRMGEPPETVRTFRSRSAAEAFALDARGEILPAILREAMLRLSPCAAHARRG